MSYSAALQWSVLIESLLLESLYVFLYLQLGMFLFFLKPLKQFIAK